MKIKLSEQESNVGGFISWQRLAEETFHGASELKLNERVTHFEISERGINYFVGTVPPATGGGAA